MTKDGYRSPEAREEEIRKYAKPKTDRPNNMTKIIQPRLIFNEVLIGKGTDGDPVRMKTEIFSGDGELLLEYDSFPGADLNHEKYCVDRLPEILLKLSNQTT